MLAIVVLGEARTEKPLCRSPAQLRDLRNAPHRVVRLRSSLGLASKLPLGPDGGWVV